MLRKKAAEELKKEQERKAAERRRIIEERCGKPKNLEDANEGIYFRFSFHKKHKIIRNQIFGVIKNFVPNFIGKIIIFSNHSQKKKKNPKSILHTTRFFP